MYFTTEDNNFSWQDVSSPAALKCVRDADADIEIDTDNSIDTDTVDTSTSSNVDCPAYEAGTDYLTGDTVENVGLYFHCDVEWRCSRGAVRFEPGVGVSWETAWTEVQSCGDKYAG